MEWNIVRSPDREIARCICWRDDNGAKAACSRAQHPFLFLAVNAKCRQTATTYIVQFVREINSSCFLWWTKTTLEVDLWATLHCWCRQCEQSNERWTRLVPLSWQRTSFNFICSDSIFKLYSLSTAGIPRRDANTALTCSSKWEMRNEIGEQTNEMNADMKWEIRTWGVFI